MSFVRQQTAISAVFVVLNTILSLLWQGDCNHNGATGEPPPTEHQPIMTPHRSRPGRYELRSALMRDIGPLLFVGIFSFFVNMLMLTGPLYMLNVYDRVLTSYSVETLIALTVLIGFLYAMMGFLDYARGRIMGRVGARFQCHMDRRVFEASIRVSGRRDDTGEAAQASRDLESVQRMMASPPLMAVFDLPWSPIYFAGIFLFHPLLGYLAVAGSLILIAIAGLNQIMTKRRLRNAHAAGFTADQIGAQFRNESDIMRALGMRRHGFSRWEQARENALSNAITANDLSGTFATVTKTFRLFLQSAMLGLGAWLAINGDLSPGAMIAGSILMGRALQPIEALINQWPTMATAFEGWRRLAALLTKAPIEVERTILPRPRAILTVNQLTIVPPGQRHGTLRGVSFRADPGQAIGVIGPSGAGKSTLAKAITGIWPAAGGAVRLDGAALDQYDSDTLGSYIGYLPQHVRLFSGTIRENIARMTTWIDDAEVIRAAQAAAAHDMILQLPKGYETPISGIENQLSGGQLQRIGLARALFGNPVMLVLDEPNSNLDDAGDQALNAAIRQFKAQDHIVLIMAHRPSAIQECDFLLVLDSGTKQAFGPRQQVLSDMVRNHQDIALAWAGRAG